MKRLLIILIALMTFCSCTVLKENYYTADLPEISYEPEIKNNSHITIQPSLYFIDLTTGKLNIESRSLVVPDNTSTEEIIIRTMLGGPMQKNMYIPCEGYVLENLEITGSLINIYLESDVDSPVLTDEQKFYSVCCIANSIVDYCTESYVSVYFDGLALGINGNPCGLLSQTDVEIETLYKDYISRNTISEENTGNSNLLAIDAPLYFMANDGKHLLCEVRRVRYEKENCVYQILKELSQGPKYNRELQQCLKSDTNWLSDIEISLNKEENEVFIYFKQNPFISGKYPTKLEFGSLFYSIIGTLPDMNKLTVEIEEYGVTTITRNNLSNLIGNNISVYIPNANFENLRAISVTVDCNDAYKLYERIIALFHNAFARYSVDANESDIIHISVNDNICVIDLEKDFYDSISDYSDRTISVILQSIVNTACEDSRIKYTLFLCNGERIKNIGKNIYLYYPLMPNVGIIS